ncbi:MAG: inorganic diphosphatase, partial [Acidithiobacillus sp.]
MDLKKIPAGQSLPDDINVVIEVPQGSSVKYELDKESGAIVVDRFLFTAMHYPLNYGF